MEKKGKQREGKRGCSMGQEQSRERDIRLRKERMGGRGKDRKGSKDAAWIRNTEWQAREGKGE